MIWAVSWAHRSARRLWVTTVFIIDSGSCNSAISRVSCSILNPWLVYEACIFIPSYVMLRVRQKVCFLVAVGNFIILFDNMWIIRIVWHGNLPINCMSIRLSKLPPLPEIKPFALPWGCSFCLLADDDLSCSIRERLYNWLVLDVPEVKPIEEDPSNNLPLCLRTQ